MNHMLLAFWRIIELPTQEGFAYATAFVSAIAWVASSLIGEMILPGTERLLDFGFAGVFVVSLIYALKIERQSRESLQKKYDVLEKEVRDALVSDLKEANRSRNEMIELMRRKEGRDLNEAA
jgi:hypothetical protein